MTPRQKKSLRAIHGTIQEEVRGLTDFIIASHGLASPFEKAKLDSALSHLNEGLREIERILK